MDDQTISEGELLAYLDGERLPHVEQALRDSPDVRAQLEALREADAFFQGIFDEGREANSQDMVDVVTGQATPQQQQRVARYLVEHPEAKAEKKALEQEWAALRSSLEPAGNEPRPYLQAFRVGLVGVRSGMRVSASEGREQAFQGEGLDARVTVRVDPSGGEFWQMTGRVTLTGQPLAGVEVTLHRAEEPPRQTTSEAAGFFAFESLTEGTYELRLYLEQGIIRIPEIVLIDE